MVHLLRALARRLGFKPAPAASPAAGRFVARFSTDPGRGAVQNPPNQPDPPPARELLARTLAGAAARATSVSGRESPADGAAVHAVTVHFAYAEDAFLRNLFAPPAPGGGAA